MERDEERLAYQGVLRTIGDVLDQMGAERFTVVEEPGGFLVTTECAGEVESTVLSPDDLARRFAAMKARRGHSQPTLRPWSFSPLTRSDLLRALGRELDAAHASSVLLDGLDAQLMVTYSFVQPGSIVWSKRMAMLDQHLVEEIHREAVECREQRRSFSRRLFL